MVSGLTPIRSKTFASVLKSLQGTGSYTLSVRFRPRRTTTSATPALQIPATDSLRRFEPGAGTQGLEKNATVAKRMKGKPKFLNTI